MINTRKGTYEPADFVGKAEPQKLPKASYWPFFLALGLTLLFWGILTGWIIGGSGLLVFFISLSGWIKDMNHEEQD